MTVSARIIGRCGPTPGRGVSAYTSPVARCRRMLALAGVSDGT